MGELPLTILSHQVVGQNIKGESPSNEVSPLLNTSGLIKQIYIPKTLNGTIVYLPTFPFTIEIHHFMDLGEYTVRPLDPCLEL